jgi:sarcosine oxidase gamma subunit
MIKESLAKALATLLSDSDRTDVQEGKVLVWSPGPGQDEFLVLDTATEQAFRVKVNLIYA